MPKTASGERTVRTGRRSVAVSHPDRVLFPDDGITKLDVARHYAEVAPVMVPHIRGRPLALQSFPQGIDEDGFFLKDAPDHYPDWLTTVRVPKRGGGTLCQVVANDAAAMVYLAGQNVITPHVWTSRADRLERPDRVVFDLDPSSADDFERVRAAAWALGDVLRAGGLVPFAMTTGSRGLHVVAPIRRTTDVDDVRAFARDIADDVADASPEMLTTAFRKDKRGDRIYVDVARNGYGQHAVAPYAIRALPGAPVATPVRWDELDDDALHARRWDIGSIGARLADVGDPWEEIAHRAKALGPARRALAAR